jgi:hypothetical protein
MKQTANCLPSFLVRFLLRSAHIRVDVCLELAANVLGRSNARKGARRIFAVLQNRRLNQHIAYVIIDEVTLPIFCVVRSSD